MPVHVDDWVPTYTTSFVHVYDKELPPALPLTPSYMQLLGCETVTQDHHDNKQLDERVQREDADEEQQQDCDTDNQLRVSRAELVTKDFWGLQYDGDSVSDRLEQDDAVIDSGVDTESDNEADDQDLVDDDDPSSADGLENGPEEDVMAGSGDGFSDEHEPAHNGSETVDEASEDYDSTGAGPTSASRHFVYVAPESVEPAAYTAPRGTPGTSVVTFPPFHTKFIDGRLVVIVYPHDNWEEVTPKERKQRPRTVESTITTPVKVAPRSTPRERTTAPRPRKATSTRPPARAPRTPARSSTPVKTIKRAGPKPRANAKPATPIPASASVDRRGWRGRGRRAAPKPVESAAVYGLPASTRLRVRRIRSTYVHRPRPRPRRFIRVQRPYDNRRDFSYVSPFEIFFSRDQNRNIDRKSHHQKRVDMTEEHRRCSRGEKRRAAISRELCDFASTSRPIFTNRARSYLSLFDY